MLICSIDDATTFTKEDLDKMDKNNSLVLLSNQKEKNIPINLFYLLKNNSCDINFEEIDYLSNSDEYLILLGEIIQKYNTNNDKIYIINNNYANVNLNENNIYFIKNINEMNQNGNNKVKKENNEIQNKGIIEKKKRGRPVGSKNKK